MERDKAVSAIAEHSAATIGVALRTAAPRALEPMLRSSHALLLLLLASACLDWASLEGGRCGDGFVGREEACDDGNQVSGDGCDGLCLPEAPSCGDGRVEADESCDDANDDSSDECLGNCELARCGDGILWEFQEQCDDGNTDPLDGCSDTCSYELDSCGDGQIDPGETCDDGGNESGDGCSASCKSEAALALCGNGVLDEGEACDDGNASNQDSCLNGCSWATCGDGQLRLGVEECDDGNINNDDACSSACVSCGLTAESHFRPSNSHCYSLHDEPATQADARAACQTEGGDLLTVTSTAESNETVKRLKLDGLYWFGFTTARSKMDGWVTGEPAQYTAFGPGEPSDRTLICVALDSPGAAAQTTWRSADCSEELKFVCERSPPFVSSATHHAYRYHAEAASFDEARRRCSDEGAYLAVLESEGELAFVGGKLFKQVWVDASETDTEGEFVWSTGAVVAADAFHVGQPDDVQTARNCLFLNVADKLSDWRCELTFPFVCEFD